MIPQDVTTAEYWHYVANHLHLKPSNVPGVFLTPKGETQGVRDPDGLTCRERGLYLGWLADALGIDQ